MVLYTAPIGRTVCSPEKLLREDKSRKYRCEIRWSSRSKSQSGQSGISHSDSITPRSTSPLCTSSRMAYHTCVITFRHGDTQSNPPPPPSIRTLRPLREDVPQHRIVAVLVDMVDSHVSLQVIGTWVFLCLVGTEGALIAW
jgi:hypothetical protein